MTAADTAREPAFRYQAVGRDGRPVSDVVHALDERAALRRLTADGLVVIRMDPVTAPAGAGAQRDMRFGERVLVMRQLALMLNAGVPLLEALETVCAGIEAGKGRRQFEAAITALKRGDSFSHAFAAHVTGFPFYVHALAGVGEASGRIGAVLRDAADQMAYEERLRRDFTNALTYPAFLACAGLSAVGFIFIEIVPRFSAMIGSRTQHMPWMSRAVLTVGDYVSSHLLLVGLAAAGLAGAIAAMVGSPGARRRLYAFGHRTPLVGRLLRTREIASWARLTAFALQNGVELLTAAALAREATPEGPLRTGLALFETDLKAGVAVDVSLGRNTALSAMDLSLLRVGQRSGALPAMFAALADKYDGELKDTLKRVTSLLEPTAVGLIAVMVGVIALSLVMALSSIYDTVS